GRVLSRSHAKSASLRNGRSSSLPPLAWGCRAAIAMASSRSSHSRMSKPAIHSFDSVKAPWVTSPCPRLTLTVVASLTGRRRSPVTRFPRPSTSASHCSMVRSSADGSASAAASGAATTNIMYFMGSCSPAKGWWRRYDDRCATESDSSTRFGSGNDLDQAESLARTPDRHLRDLANALDEVLVVHDLLFEGVGLLRSQGVAEGAVGHADRRGAADHLEHVLGVALVPLLPELTADLRVGLHVDAGLG